MDRADLIAALEKAEGPSRELDAEIGALTRSLPECPAEWLAKWEGPFAAFCWGAHGWRVAAMQDNGDRAVHWEPPHFTASLDAALSLVPEGDREVIVAMRSNRKPCAEISSFPGYVSAHGPTPAIALCIAALRAMD